MARVVPPEVVHEVLDAHGRKRPDAPVTPNGAEASTCHAGAPATRRVGDL